MHIQLVGFTRLPTCWQNCDICGLLQLNFPAKKSVWELHLLNLLPSYTFFRVLKFLPPLFSNSEEHAILIWIIVNYQLVERGVGLLSL